MYKHWRLFLPENPSRGFFFSQKEPQENKMLEVWESERKMAVMSSMKVTQASRKIKLFWVGTLFKLGRIPHGFFIFFVSKPATEITSELSGCWNLIMNLHSDSRQSVPGNESIHSQISFTPSFTLQVLSGHRRLSTTVLTKKWQRRREQIFDLSLMSPYPHPQTLHLSVFPP